MRGRTAFKHIGVESRADSRGANYGLAVKQTRSMRPHFNDLGKQALLIAHAFIVDWSHLAGEMNYGCAPEMRPKK